MRKVDRMIFWDNRSVSYSQKMMGHFVEVSINRWMKQSKVSLAKIGLIPLFHRHNKTDRKQDCGNMMINVRADWNGRKI